MESLYTYILVLGIASSTGVLGDCPSGTEEIKSNKNPEYFTMEINDGSGWDPLVLPPNAEGSSNSVQVRVSLNNFNPDDFLLDQIELEIRFADKCTYNGVQKDGGNAFAFKTLTWEPAPKTEETTVNIECTIPEGEWGIKVLKAVVCVPVSWCEWSNSDCEGDCDTGVITRTRVCGCPNPKPDKFECDGEDTETETCPLPCCEEPPEWDDWGPWGTCDVTCGGGSQSRSRDCIEAECPDGTDCVGDDTQTRACGEECCPVPPAWGDWGDWGECMGECETGVQSRSRQCEPSSCPAPGDVCEGADEETRECQLGCCFVQPEWKEWESWSSCSETCGNGIRTRGRSCDLGLCPQGQNCEGTPLEKDQCYTCCEVRKDYLNQDGLTVLKETWLNGAVNKSVSAPKFLDGSGKRSNFLYENKDGKQQISVQFDEVEVLEIGVNTYLANEVSLSPGAGWIAKPPTIVDPHKRGTKTKFRPSSGSSSINGFKLTFGFPEGEIVVRDIYVIICV